jgi:hypothetical protein
MLTCRPAYQRYAEPIQERLAFARFLARACRHAPLVLARPHKASMFERAQANRRYRRLRA